MVGEHSGTNVLMPNPFLIGCGMHLGTTVTQTISTIPQGLVQLM